MAARSSPHLSIVEAVEVLSSIADLELDREIGIAQKHELILGHEKIAYQTVHWLNKQDGPATVNLVKEIFRVLLHYLRQFYKKEYAEITDKTTLEEIRAIMVLVGEAANKLDKYTQLFHQTQKVTDFNEYKQLQEFYQNKISSTMTEGTLRNWVASLWLEKREKKIQFKAHPKKGEKLTETQRQFVDLDTVKKDTEYELFFIRKEDGSRFFSPRLLRNIKLVCDFSSYFGERRELDPLQHVQQWMDRVLNQCAKDIIKTVGSRIDKFFREKGKVKEQELARTLQKGLVALMLSSHTRNLISNHPVKNCTEYFEDFQGFWREALHAHAYQRWIRQPPKEEDQLDLLDLIHTLSRAIYVNLQGLLEIKPIVQRFLQEAPTQGGEASKKMGARLEENYSTLTHLLKHHPNGPLLKVIAIMEGDAYHSFDSLLQHNIPHQLFDFLFENKRISVLRIPAPIYQEFINKAIVDEEFKGFIRDNTQGAKSRKHLLINLQDRTSWREHFRCLALEELQREPDMEKGLSVVTFATDTDFYHQLSPYHQVNHAHQFMEQFKELLLDENGGYFFPNTIGKEDLDSFIDHSFAFIHRLFFSSKNVLTKENRLDFIDLFHLLLQLKLIEWLHPDTISLTCKDGIDLGEASSALQFAFFKLINQEEWSEADQQHLNFMLYAPALLIRERLILPDRYHRFLNTFKVIENASEEHGAKNFAKLLKEGLSPLYKMPLAQAQILLPRS